MIFLPAVSPFMGGSISEEVIGYLECMAIESIYEIGPRNKLVDIESTLPNPVTLFASS